MAQITFDQCICKRRSLVEAQAKPLARNSIHTSRRIPNQRDIAAIDAFESAGGRHRAAFRAQDRALHQPIMEFRELVFERCKADPRIARDQYDTDIAHANRRHVRLHAFTPMNFDVIRPRCASVMPPAPVSVLPYVAALKSPPAPHPPANATPTPITT